MPSRTRHSLPHTRPSNRPARSSFSRHIIYYVLYTVYKVQENGGITRVRFQRSFFIAHEHSVYVRDDLASVRPPSPTTLLNVSLAAQFVLPIKPVPSSATGCEMSVTMSIMYIFRMRQSLSCALRQGRSACVMYVRVLRESSLISSFILRTASSIDIVLSFFFFFFASYNKVLF